MDDEFISVSEVARLCKLSRPTAIARLRTGEIPGRVTHHGIQRVVREVFLKWLSPQGN